MFYKPDPSTNLSEFETAAIHVLCLPNFRRDRGGGCSKPFMAIVEFLDGWQRWKQLDVNNMMGEVVKSPDTDLDACFASVRGL